MKLFRSSSVPAPKTWEAPEIIENGERVTHLWANDCYYTHLSIYAFSLAYAVGADVLDAGCGAGYGSAYLAEHGARSVLGVDVSAKAIEFDEGVFKHAALRFRQLALEEVGSLGAGSFDFVYCSNVLEHIRGVPNFLRGAISVLRDSGVMLAAIPPITCAAARDEDLGNPNHINFWSPRQWQHVLRQYFWYVQPFAHRVTKPGYVLNMTNAPNECHITEHDFEFPPIRVVEFYTQPSTTSVFVCRGPLALEDVPLPGQPLSFVDDSMSR